MSIEKVKEKARRHEQKEEWQAALALYTEAIKTLEAQDQPDIGLYNRLGDLCVRVNRLDDAVKNYEKAADLYAEAELPNNAIAVCKKIVRNAPTRHSVYLKMGQIRARQGFLTDARTNFLTYAERMQQAGNLDESFRALVEFADLVPDDIRVREMVAQQLVTHRRVDDAVEQYALIYDAFMERGLSAEAMDIQAKVARLSPGTRLDGRGAPAPVSEPEPEPVYETIEFDEPEPIEIEPPLATVEVDEPAGGYGDIALPDHPTEVELLGHVSAGDDLDLSTLGGVEDEVEEEAEALPTFDFEEEADEIEFVSATMDVDADVQESDLAGAVFSEPLVDEVDLPEPEPVETPVAQAPVPPPAPVEEVAAPPRAEPSLDDLIAENPDDTSLWQRLVERAYKSGNEVALVRAYIGMAQALDRTGQAARAKASYQQVIQIDPENETARRALGMSDPAAAGAGAGGGAAQDYVDLGSLLLGDTEEKTTRFVVEYQEPTGDEEADFRNMLAQFKEKVAENLDAHDVGAHHDLGTAYMEMGLLDEAVGEFQQALRAAPDHLPTYELLGQCFLQMEKPDMAVRTLTRATESRPEVEDEFIGIYYYLGRAYEAEGNSASAVEYYDRVFSLDINFADVTERLRVLR